MKASLTYDKHTKWSSIAHKCYVVVLDAVCCMRQAIFW